MKAPTSHENGANPRPFPQHLGDEKRRNRPLYDPVTGASASNDRSDATQDPHIVCSQGARNCSDCFTTCDEDNPCPCCGGEVEDMDEWFVRCDRCREWVLAEHGETIYAPRPGSDLMSGTFVCDDCWNDDCWSEA